MHDVLAPIIHEWRFLLSTGLMLGMLGYFCCGLGASWSKRVSIILLAALTLVFSGVFGYFIFASNGIAVAAIIALFWAACMWITAPVQFRISASVAANKVAHANAMIEWARANIDRFKQQGTDSMTEASLKIALQNPEVVDAEREKVCFLLAEDMMQEIGHKVGEYRAFEVSVDRRVYTSAYNEEVFGVSVADLERYAADTTRTYQRWIPQA
jgi:hypothetical protein